MLRGLLLVLVLSGSARVVAGEPGGRAAAAVRDARAHLAAADRAFRKARYDEALAQVQAAYAADPRPEFLIVFAQIYRAMGQPQRAVEACELYLAAAPDGSRAQEARALASAARQEAASAAAAPVDAPPVVAPAAVAPKLDPSAAPALVVAPTPDPAVAVAPAHKRRKAIFIGVGIASVTVVGLALGLGLGLGLHHELPHISFDPGSAHTP
jgi:hypothetical protein